jgi:outer membrane protein assembly factor BamB
MSIVLLPPFAGAAEPPAPRIQALLQRIDLRNGLCALIGDFDPALVRELAATSEIMFYVQSDDAQRVKSIRETCDAAGLLNRRVFVEQRGYDMPLPLAEAIVDRVVVRSDAFRNRDELMRVLVPGGKAATFRQGQWTVESKDALTNADAWSHPYHTPDNNPLSNDPVAKYPYLTHFLAEPLFSSQPEVTVAAGGRVYKAFGHMAFKEYQNPSINVMFAMNAFNGTILWKKPVKEGFMIHRNTMIATGDTLLVGDDESLKIIDGATGNVRDEIVVPPGQADGPVWKWMGLGEDGILYALVGATEVKAPVTKGTGTAITGWPWGMWPGYDYRDPKSAWGFGRNFIAIDLKTRKILWNLAQERPIDSRGVCMKNGRIYFYCPEKLLGCIDARTGNPIWTTSDPAVLAAGDVAEHRGVLYGLWPAAYAQGVVAGANAVGASLEFHGLSPSTRLKVLDVDLFSIGQIHPLDASQPVLEQQEGQSYLRLVCADGRLIGANLYGDTRLAGVIKEAVESRAQLATVTELLARVPAAAGLCRVSRS